MKDPKSLHPFFYPATVAIVGASHSSGSVGRAILENFAAGKFKGKVHPVNPHYPEILGLKAYTKVGDIPEKIDLAVICTPAAVVPEVYRECGEKGIPAVILVSSGFDEIGNQELTGKLKAEMRKFQGTRMIGPNCLGVYNAENGVDTMFLPAYRMARPEFGDVSFVSQSGALGNAILDWAHAQGYGISKFISYGNAWDVNETDLVEYLLHDKATKVISLYVEGFKEGRRFFELAKKHGGKKPVIVLKGGITPEGTQATLSHTGSLAGSAQVFEALFKQTPLVKAASLLELFDFARCFARCPLPAGKRVQIITDGGGYGILTADAVGKNGLELARMSEKAVQRIREVVPGYVILKNPMDLTGDATNERYAVAIEQALLDPAVDMVVAIVLYQVPSLDSRIVDIVAELKKKYAKPLIVISVGGDYSQLHMRALEREGVVNFTYPEEAIGALKALWEFAEKKAGN